MKKLDCNIKHFNDPPNTNRILIEIKGFGTMTTFELGYFEKSPGNDHGRYYIENGHREVRAISWHHIPKTQRISAAEYEYNN